jgi:2-oxoglutarate dehydrogenase E2 component (dihydrolipoamide succinyltransferase)
MPIELKVPEVGESITEVMIGTWKKREGDVVAIDDSIVEIESDKATVELPAPAAGTLVKALKPSGSAAKVGEVIGYLEPAGAASGAPGVPPAPAPVVDVKRTEGRTTIGSVQPPAPPAGPQRVMPAAARVLGEAGVAASGVHGTGPRKTQPGRWPLRRRRGPLPPRPPPASCRRWPYPVPAKNAFS